MKKVKTAIIGSGKIVPDFLDAASHIPALEIHTIWGREQSVQKLQHFQTTYQIPNYCHDYNQLLKNPDIQAVYIALPNHLHYAYAKCALENRKHVIMEKPFTSTCAQAEELVHLATEKHCILFEAISNQYLPNYKRTKELIPLLGDIKIVQLNYSQYSSRYDQFKQGIILPAFDPAQSGGALMDLNVYNIYFVVGLFGMPEHISYHANLEKGVDTSGILIMEYPHFQCVCIGAKDCRAPLSINIQGDRGFIHSDSASNVYTDFVFAANDCAAPQTYSLNQDMPRLYYELEVFAEMVNNCDFEKAARFNRRTLEVMDILDRAMLK